MGLSMQSSLNILCSMRVHGARDEKIYIDLRSVWRLEARKMGEWVHGREREENSRRIEKAMTSRALPKNIYYINLDKWAMLTTSTDFWTRIKLCKKQLHNGNMKGIFSLFAEKLKELLTNFNWKRKNIACEQMKIVALKISSNDK